MNFRKLKNLDPFKKLSVPNKVLLASYFVLLAILYWKNQSWLISPVAFTYILLDSFFNPEVFAGAKIPQLPPMHIMPKRVIWIVGIILGTFSIHWAKNPYSAYTISLAGLCVLIVFAWPLKKPKRTNLQNVLDKTSKVS